MKTKVLINKLWKMFPSKIAKKYNDYVGLMVPCLKEEVSKIVLCLDVSNEAIKVATETNADLIISHHPFIYGKKSSVLKFDKYKKEKYDLLMKKHIAVYSFHTNFDEGVNGMNDALAESLKLNNIRPINNLPIARMGELDEEMDINVFAKYALNCLNLEYCQLINKGKRIIKTVGIIGGAGSGEYQIALENGCDIFLSGDTPYHIRKEISERGLNYLNVDHEIEKIFCNQMKKILLSINKDLEIIVIDDVRQMDLIVR